MEEIVLLQRMVEELRRQRESCEPKNSGNTRYLKYSNAIHSINWVIGDRLPEVAAQS